MSFSSPESSSSAATTITVPPFRTRLPPQPYPGPAPPWFPPPPSNNFAPGPSFIGPPRPIPMPAMRPPLPLYHPRWWPLLRPALPNPVLYNWAAYASYIHSAIRNQVEYYFSKENLIKDLYLRKHMDGQGWVDIGLIAGFNRISRLTRDVNVVLDALRISSVVEVCDGKVRRRGDWSAWVITKG
ncbi:unnamed protein product [Linum trigynum]|uniref:HTH La-type RNA-binding domain-containing protein n=1 Tax=Linum trigynum TaxID=586398 RepID=A0AAV2GSN6_9ROSI